MKKQRLGSERIRDILRALDFTPRFLAVALDTTESKARRILRPGSRIYFHELMQILQILRDITPNLLMGGAGRVYGKKEGGADNGEAQS